MDRHIAMRVLLIITNVYCVNSNVGFMLSTTYGVQHCHLYVTMIICGNFTCNYAYKTPVLLSEFSSLPVCKACLLTVSQTVFAEFFQFGESQALSGR